VNKRTEKKQLELLRASLDKYTKLITHYKRNYSIGLQQPHGHKPDTRLDIIKELAADAQYRINAITARQLEDAISGKKKKKTKKAAIRNNAVKIKKPTK